MSTCATASRDLAEPVAATAATARTWLLIEQPGPWGGKALTESRLDPTLGGGLEAAAGAHGARVALIRRPGRHADRPGGRRRVFLAHTSPGNSWVRTALVGQHGAGARTRADGPGAAEETDADAETGTDTGIDTGKGVGVDMAAALRGLDFAALSAGEHGGLWAPYTGDPLALVCTNGKRDRCCALLGRPLAAELAASGLGDVWEITHIGGHRFAPTLLVLPYGYAYARASARTVKGVLGAVRDGRVVTEGCRGRSAWDRPGQAADLAVREHAGEPSADALTVLRTRGDAPRWNVTVGHTDGRVWRVAVAAMDDGLPVPAACGAAPGAPERMHVEDITLVAGQVTARPPV
ncbi:sucrase ferredoxin [Streptomyces daliensis]